VKKMTRRAVIKRKTRETEIKVDLKLDGRGKGTIKSGIPFFNHMLELFARHGHFDLSLAAKGDLEVDFHHTVEDIGICLGQAFDQALGSRRGIRRYGQATIPMDEALATVALDISGRSLSVYNPKIRRIKIGNFNLGLIKAFFKAFSDHAGITVHVNVFYGEDAHHVIEAIFKAFGRSLSQAVLLDPRVKGVPSTKGRL
jgi:imidazoleglycerol-phosphate dehydratase